MKYRVLLIDVDNTLLNFTLCEKKAVALSLIQVGIEPYEDRLQLYSRINDGLWKLFEKGLIAKTDIYVGRFKEFLKRIDIETDAKALSDIYRRNLSKFYDKIDGADDVLCYLSGKYAIYYITNGMAETQKIRIAKSGINRFAKGYFISETVGAGKPSALYFNYVLNKIGVQNTNELLIIGDSMTSDILGGKNAGIDTCWLDMGREKRLYPTEFTVNSLYELKNIL